MSKELKSLVTQRKELIESIKTFAISTVPTKDITIEHTTQKQALPEQVKIFVLKPEQKSQRQNGQTIQAKA